MSAADREIFSESGPDGWRHTLRADHLGDRTTLCGQEASGGLWARHKAPPSCPACRGQLEAQR